MEEHEHIEMKLDRDPELARLVIDTAIGLAKGPPKVYPDPEQTFDDPEGGKRYYHKRLDSDHVKEAADLVILALTLLSDRPK